MKTTENNNFETFSADAVEEFIEKKTYEQIKKTSKCLARVSSVILSLLAAAFQTGPAGPVYTFMFFVIVSLVIFNIIFFAVGYTAIFSPLKNRHMSGLSIIDKYKIITDKIEKNLLSCNKYREQILKEQKNLSDSLIEVGKKQETLSEYLKQLK